MRKTLIKNIGTKPRAAGAGKIKSSDSNKKNALAAIPARKKNSGIVIDIFNYQYQDSDLEQFVF